jgi:hypothetical protein
MTEGRGWRKSRHARGTPANVNRKLANVTRKVRNVRIPFAFVQGKLPNERSKLASVKCNLALDRFVPLFFDEKFAAFHPKALRNARTRGESGGKMGRRSLRQFHCDLLVKDIAVSQSTTTLPPRERKPPICVKKTSAVPFCSLRLLWTTRATPKICVSI